MLLQELLANTDGARCHFNQFIFIDEVQCLFQRILDWWRQDDVFIGTGSTDVSELLGLGGVDHQIVTAGVNTNDLAF